MWIAGGQADVLANKRVERDVDDASPPSSRICVDHINYTPLGQHDNNKVDGGGCCCICARRVAKKGVE